MKSLKSKVFILTFTPLVLFFLTIMINMQIFEKGRSVNDAYSFFSSVLRNYAQSVIKWQSGRANMVQNIAGLNKQKLISRDFLLSTSQAYKVDVYYVQNDGKVYASDQDINEYNAGQYAEPYDPREEEWFKKAGNVVFMDDMVYEETVDDWVVSWVIRKDDGVFGFDVRIDDMDIADKDLKLPGAGKLLLVDSRDQIIIWEDNKDRGRKASELNSTLDSQFLKKIIENSPKEFTRFTDHSGKEMWIIGTHIGASGWKLYICLDQSILLSSLNTTIYTTYVALIILMILVFLSVHYCTNRYISSPVTRITRLISNMNSNHDFTERSECRSNDEIGVMSKNMNEFMNEQCRIVSSVKDIGDAMLNGIETCSSIVSNVNEELKNQEKATVDFANSISEMNSATDRISESSDDVARKVSSVHTLSSNSVEIANNAKASVNVLNDDLSNSSEAIKHLNDLTVSVVEVVETIRDIAEQTNLLALNASIEAARAGENGRGFAVVADEVRALSSRTKESIAEIEETTQAFKVGTAKAVSMIKKSSDSCMVTIEWVGSIEDKLREINVHIADISKITDFIATSTTVQEHNFELVQNGMEQIRRSAQKISTDMSSCSEAYSELSGNAYEMMDVFSRFKLKNVQNSESYDDYLSKYDGTETESEESSDTKKNV